MAIYKGQQDMKSRALDWILPAEDVYVKIALIARVPTAVYATHLVALFWYEEQVWELKE